MQNEIMLNKYDDQLLKNGLDLVDKFINKTYLLNIHDAKVIKNNINFKLQNIRLFLIDKIVVNEDENVNDKLISVYSAMHNVDVTTCIMIRGTKEETSFYIGISNLDDSKDIGTLQSTLQKSFNANFPGSSLKQKKNSEIENILKDVIFEEKNCNVSCVSIVPSIRDDDKDHFVQGIEKFIDTMQGDSYTALFISKPLVKKELDKRKENLESLYTTIFPFLKDSISYAESDSIAVSQGLVNNFSHTISNSLGVSIGSNVTKTVSESNGKSVGFNSLFNTTTSNTKTQGISVGASTTRTETKGTSDTLGVSESKTDTYTKATTKTITKEFTNKTVEMILSKIEDQLIRIKDCESFGLWESAAYFLSEQYEVSVVAANTYKALVSGDGSNVESTFINTWKADDDLVLEMKSYFKKLSHPNFELNETRLNLANIISGKEIPLFMGIPLKSVNGLSVTTMAEYSRNVFMRNAILYSKQNDSFELGCIHHMGVNENENKVNLDLNTFTSHCFVTGSTGSGKSNTTYLLLENFLRYKIPFLVIEPAKGEYKSEFGNLKNINIFTTNQYTGAMLKINPFKFPSNIHVLEHLDRLIEIFNACWEMYAAMPAIFKNSIEKAYIQKGWDLTYSIYMKEGVPQYPNFYDVLNILPQIIKETSYSSDSQGDYTGALVTRVESLTNGICGQIFCDVYSIDESILFDQNTIVDLSRVGSSETKSLIMGLLVLQLSEYRIANANGTNKKLSHITVIEEAHNLLKNVEKEQTGSNVVGKSVEMICNSIAEMRTYGEGFVIVDQSPSSVDIAAIKNTNTKIIMRLPEKSDCEAIGNSIGLKENQIIELSKLPVGVAAVMQNNWLDSVLCKVNKSNGCYQKDFSYYSYKDLRKLNINAINWLLNQIENRTVKDITSFKNIANKIYCPDYAKEEMLLKVQDIFNNCIYPNKNIGLFSNYLIRLSGLSSLLKKNQYIIKKQEEDMESVIKWRKQMNEDLKYFFTTDKEKFFNNLIKYSLFSDECLFNKEVRYDLLLKTFSSLTKL